MTRLCGERYQRQRVHTRYGHQQDVATLAGQKVSITRPRARQVDGGRNALGDIRIQLRLGRSFGGTLRSVRLAISFFGVSSGTPSVIQVYSQFRAMLRHDRQAIRRIARIESSSTTDTHSAGRPLRK